MAYNQTLVSTTEICVTSGTTYCEEWLKTEEITYNSFNLLVYLLLPIITFVLIGFLEEKENDFSDRFYFNSFVYWPPC